MLRKEITLQDWIDKLHQDKGDFERQEVQDYLSSFMFDVICLFEDVIERIEKLEQNKMDEFICGFCKYYDSGAEFCTLHPEYGELCEKDTCNDWKEGE